jgi:Zn-dependent protease with chaperone function
MNLRNKKNKFFRTSSLLLLTISFFLITSCSTLTNISNLGAGSAFTPTNLLTTAADAALKPRSAEGFPTDPLNIPSIQEYVEKVRANLDAFAVNKYMKIYLYKTARVQGQSVWGEEIDITRGMLNMINNEAELACLIGHEIGHADLNHQYAQRNDGILDKLAGAGITAAGKATGKEYLADEINNKRDIIMQASWSQANEQAADEYGAVLAAKAGYDPYAFCDLFDRLMLKVKGDSFYYAGKLTSTHKALDERAAHLRKYLRDKGYRRGKGLLNKKAYQLAMAGLKDIHTGEGPKTGQNIDDPKDIQDFSDIEAELKQHQKDGTKLPAARFLQIMRRYSQFLQKNHAGKDQLLSVASAVNSSAAGQNSKSHTDKFMAETIYQDNFFDPNSPDGLGRPGKMLVAGLDLIAKVGLSIAAPEIMIPIMAFEAIDGHDFFTGDQLTNAQRVLSGVGAFGAVASEAIEAAQMGEYMEGMAQTEQTAQEGEAIINQSESIFKNGTDWNLRSSSEINDEFTANGDMAPYQEDTDVLDFKTTQDQQMFRVHGPDNAEGDWLINFDPGQYTPSELKDMLSLKYEPTGYSEVTVPQGTNLRVGIAGPVKTIENGAENVWGNGGSIQFQMLDGWKETGATFKYIGGLH